MADTVVNTLYPPLIETFQPAFVYDDAPIITFSISPFNNISEIKAIHVSVADQRNHSNVLKPYLELTKNDVDNGMYYGISNGIFIAQMPTFTESDIAQQIFPIAFDPIHNLYGIQISPEWLSPNTYWNNNQYYQIQIRFDKTDLTNGYTKDFSSYMLDNRRNFSEWSSVTLIKPILEPTISIVQFDGETERVFSYPGLYRINGNIAFENVTNKDGITTETEKLQSYRILVTDSSGENTVDDTGWCFPQVNTDINNSVSINQLIDLTKAENLTQVIVNIFCKTNNGYACSKAYDLYISSYSTVWDDSSIKWNNLTEEEKSKTDETITNNTILINQEDGIAKINFSAEININAGTIYIRQACSKDNYKNWELIYEKALTNWHVNVEFEDYTISSLYKYKYSAQIQTDNGTWSSIKESAEIYPQFYEMLLMRKNRQIAIRYNGQISSWKPIVNRQKIDTLGGRYPKFVENAVMNYKTYSISGLISAEGDFNRKFLNELDGEYVYDIEGNEEYEYYYKNNIDVYDETFKIEYLLRNDTYADGETVYPQKNQPTHRDKKDNIVARGAGVYPAQLKNQHDSYPHNHWYWEREFREQLVAWLNDGEPKLYRSMPEGNIAVMLTDINLTPNSQLGRMIYNFNATMYEIADGYDLEQLNNLGIIEIPDINARYLSGIDWDNISDELVETNFGEVKTIVKRYTIKSNSNIQNYVNGNSSVYNPNHFDEDAWDELTLREQLSAYYSGKNGDYQVNDNSIKLQNLKLQFTTPPHYFNLDNEGNFTLATSTTPWLGYVINIADSKDNNTEQVFINQKGFYQIPDGTNIKSISLFNGVENEKIDIDCVCTYRISRKPDSESVEPRPIKNIIGQYYEHTMPLDEDIIPLINRTYAQEKTIGSSREIYYFSGCAGLLIDVTPYAVFEYKYKQADPDENAQTFVIGQTGIFNMFKDWKLKHLIFKGRRMTVVSKDQYHLNEWECYKETKSYSSFEDILKPRYNHCYTVKDKNYIYYIDDNWYPIETTTTFTGTDFILAKVPIYGMVNYHGQLIKEVRNA